jgi:DNA ligase-4
MNERDNIISHWLDNYPYILKLVDEGKDIERYYILPTDSTTYKYSNNNVIVPIDDNCKRVAQYLYVLPTSSREKFTTVYIDGAPIELPQAMSTQEIISHFKLNALKDVKISSFVTKKVSPEQFLMPYDALARFYKTYASSNVAGKKGIAKKLFGFYKGDCFILLRLLLPQFDTRQYNLKETNLVKAFIKALDIPKKSPVAERLRDWKDALAGSKKTFEEYISEVISPFSMNVGKKTSVLTIADVDVELDKLSYGKEDQRKIVLRNLIRKLTIDENVLLIRIILKKGLSEDIILSSYHPEAPMFFNATSNLEQTCRELKTAESHFDYSFIRPFSPIRPMLATRKNLTKLKFEKDTSLIVEPKFDGERVQIHIVNKKVGLFSRQGTNVTQLYKEIIPYILKGITSATQSVIIDGELILWNTKKQQNEPFGKMKPRANIVAGETSTQFNYLAFDVLYYNGQHIMDQPLRKRKNILNKVIETPTLHRFELTPVEVVKDLTTVKKYLDMAAQANEEGIMLKYLDSQYLPGVRSKGWIKLKPGYVDGAGVTELDCIIMGAYKAESSKKGSAYSSFVVGIRKGNTILSLTKVANGFDVKTLETLNTELTPLFHTFGEVPSVSLEFGKGLLKKDRPDMWIAPEDSRVLTIKGQEFAISDTFAAGYAVRFPIVSEIRYDKDSNDVTTYDEILQIIEEFGGTMQNTQPSSQGKEGDVTTMGGGGATAISRKPYTVPAHFKQADVSKVQKGKDVFGGKKIVIMNGDDQHSKEELEKLAYAHGAVLQQIPTTATEYIVAGKHTVRVQNLEKAGQKIHDIAWLLKFVQ